MCRILKPQYPAYTSKWLETSAHNSLLKQIPGATYTRLADELFGPAFGLGVAFSGDGLELCGKVLQGSGQPRNCGLLDLER